MSRTIVRQPLRDDVFRDIRERILEGELAPGSRVRDTQLAEELGVSRTPVREALVRLAHAGYLTADVGRGFSVRVLRADDVRHGYPILWTLECLALQSVPVPDAATLTELHTLNAQLADPAIVPAQRVALDEAWHDALLRSCGNPQLLAMIRSLKGVLQIYEHAYARREPAAGSTAEHARILAALAAGDRAAATATLELNWRGTMDRLVPWLAAQAAASP